MSWPFYPVSGRNDLSRYTDQPIREVCPRAESRSSCRESRRQRCRNYGEFPVLPRRQMSEHP